MTVTYSKEIREAAARNGHPKLFTFEVRGSLDSGKLCEQTPMSKEDAKWWVDRWIEFQEFKQGKRRMIRGVPVLKLPPSDRRRCEHNWVRFLESESPSWRYGCTKCGGCRR